jgi:hypothetical protein
MSLGRDTAPGLFCLAAARRPPGNAFTHLCRKRDNALGVYRARNSHVALHNRSAADTGEDQNGAS